MTLFEFALFILFSGYHFSLQAMQIPAELNLTSQRIIQGWLRIAEQEQVAPETTVVIESQTKRKQSSSAEMSGWRFFTEYTEYKDYAAGDDWTVDYFSWIFITPDGHAYQPSELMKVMKGKEDYAPYRTRNVPSPWPEDDPHPPGSMYNKSLMLFYGVAKRIAAIRGITWRWRIPYLSEGCPPFCE